MTVIVSFLKEFILGIPKNKFHPSKWKPRQPLIASRQSVDLLNNTIASSSLLKHVLLESVKQCNNVKVLNGGQSAL